MFSFYAQITARSRLFFSRWSKAYDDLEEIVQKLGDEHGASLTWAKHQSEKLKQSKRYLKTDYKVSMKRKKDERRCRPG